MTDFRRIRLGSLLSLLLGAAMCVAACVAPSAAQDACLVQGHADAPESTGHSSWVEGEDSAFETGPYELRPQFRDLSLPHEGTPTGPRSRRSSGRGVSYFLAPWMKANVKYKHAFLFESAPSGTIREQARSGFSVEGDRDIFDFTMSWEMARSSLNLGYRLESTRPVGGALPEESSSGWFPGSAVVLHGLTVGVTRRWGGAP